MGLSRVLWAPAVLYLLLASSLAGCLQSSSPFPITFEIPILHSGARAVYESTNSSGDKVKIEFRFEPKTIVTSSGDWDTGVVVRVSQEPPPATATTVFGEESLPGHLGFVAGTAFGLDSCVTPQWVADDSTVDFAWTLIGLGDRLVPPFVLAAGLVLQQDRPMAPEAPLFGRIEDSDNQEVRMGDKRTELLLVRDHVLYATSRDAGDAPYESGDAWMFEYGPENPFPATARAWVGANYYLRLLEWSNAGEPLTPCAGRGDRPGVDAARIAVSSRATAEGPSVAYDLQLAVRAAEADETLTVLQSFLEGHPDAFVALWALSPTERAWSPPDPPLDLRGLWTIAFVAPGSREWIAADCEVNRMGGGVLPDDVRVDCTERREELTDATEPVAWDSYRILNYAYWIDIYPRLYGRIPEFFSYRVSNQTIASGALGWWQEPGEDEPLPLPQPCPCVYTNHELVYDADSGTMQFLINPDMSLF